MRRTMTILALLLGALSGTAYAQAADASGGCCCPICCG